MTISPTSTSPLQTPHQGIRSQVRKDVQGLTTALQSGGLKTAQTSFADLQKLLQSSAAITAASTTGTSTGRKPVLSDFHTLEKDLSSGDLASAQKDSAQLQPGATQQVAGHRHHHHHPDAPPPPAPATATTHARTAQSAPPTVNLVA